MNHFNYSPPLCHKPLKPKECRSCALRADEIQFAKDRYQGGQMSLVEIRKGRLVHHRAHCLRIIKKWRDHYRFLVHEYGGDAS